MKKMLSICWLVALVFSIFCGASLLLAERCFAVRLNTFNGVFDPSFKHDDLYNPNIYAKYKITLPMDGLVTVTVIYNPLDSRGDVRHIFGHVKRPVEMCKDNWSKSLGDYDFESGNINGPYPAETGEYQLSLWSWYDPDSSPYSYVVYVDYTKSDPVTADQDPNVGSSIWTCANFENHDYGTLKNGSIFYSHLNYLGCYLDPCDNLYFKVSKTGRYHLQITSNQIDITKCSLRGWLTKYSTVNSSDSLFKIQSKDDYLNYLVGNIYLEKGFQYNLNVYLGNSYFDTQYCYGALEFQLIEQYKPVTVEQVKHSEKTVCGITEEITITIKNPNDVNIHENVLCEMKCLPDKTFVVRDFVLLPAGKSANVKLSWDIPRDLLTGRCNISCGVDYANESNMDVLCDKLPPIGSIYMLLKNVFGSHD